MAWMLQPHNYTQVTRPNLYRVDYRRVGTYKGMGQTYSTDSPLDTSSIQVPVNLPIVSPQEAAATQALYGPPGTIGGPSIFATIPTWVPWAMAGAFAVFLLAGGRR